MTPKRYSLEAKCTVEPMNARMIEREDGQWVSFEDYETMRKRLERQRGYRGTPFIIPPSHGMEK